MSKVTKLVDERDAEAVAAIIARREQLEKSAEPQVPPTEETEETANAHNTD